MALLGPKRPLDPPIPDSAGILQLIDEPVHVPANVARWVTPQSDSPAAAAPPIRAADCLRTRMPVIITPDPGVRPWPS